MKKIIFFAITLALIGTLRAQNVESYNWDPVDKTSGITEEERQMPEIYLEHHQVYDYAYVGEDLFLFKTVHVKVLTNNSASVEANNKIYIAMKDVVEIKGLKARTINPEGEVVELDKSNIKELKDEEGKGYQIFAVEGAEEGGIIEYTYTLKMEPDLYGRIFKQFSSPIKSGSITFYTPENLFFKFKSYNGLPEMVLRENKDSLKYHTYVVSVANIPGLNEEKFSSYQNNLMRLEFKLNYNTKNGSRQVYTWANAAINSHDNLYNLNKNETKALSKIVKEIDLSAANTTQDKIFTIEDFLKSHYYIKESTSNELFQLDFIRKNKFTSKNGITKLMANVFKSFGINHELVVTSSRDNVRFDKDFESYTYLNEYLLYFPDEKIFISPASIELRYGLVPASLTATYGLWIKNCKITDFYYPVADIIYIPETDYTKNFDNMDVDVSFDPDFEDIKVNLKRSFRGYGAAYPKIAFMYLENEKKKAMQQDLVKYIASDAEIDSLSFENVEFNKETVDLPLVLNASFTSASFIERAGKDIIFNIGNIIGEQSELYQEKERLTEVENDFNRGYLRNIKVNIPEGYKISNPDDLILKYDVKEGGDIIYQFHSEYSLEGNVLQIRINEFYNKIFYPAEKFDDFRKVINAAADFNKINLILQKL